MLEEEKQARNQKRILLREIRDLLIPVVKGRILLFKNKLLIRVELLFELSVYDTFIHIKSLMLKSQITYALQDPRLFNNIILAVQFLQSKEEEFELWREQFQSKMISED